MPEWTEETPTMELRWVRGEILSATEASDNILQQKWKVVRGGLGRVEYSEEWRDVPVVDGED